MIDHQNNYKSSIDKPISLSHCKSIKFSILILRTICILFTLNNKIQTVVILILFNELLRHGANTNPSFSNELIDSADWGIETD